MGFHPRSTHAPAGDRELRPPCPPAAGVTYTDLGGGDPPTGGPLFDGGGSGVGIGDVRPQRRLRGGCQDLIQFLCTAKGGTVSATWTLTGSFPVQPHC